MCSLKDGPHPRKSLIPSVQYDCGSLMICGWFAVSRSWTDGIMNSVPEYFSALQHLICPARRLRHGPRWIFFNKVMTFKPWRMSQSFWIWALLNIPNLTVLRGYGCSACKSDLRWLKVKISLIILFNIFITSSCAWRMSIIICLSNYRYQ